MNVSKYFLAVFVVAVLGHASAVIAQEAGPAQPPTREAFTQQAAALRAEVSALEQRVAVLAAQRDAVRAEEAALREASGAISKQLSESNTANDAAWDQVRQLIFARADQAKIAEAVNAAREHDKQHYPKSKPLREQSEALSEQSRELGEKSSALSSAYSSLSAELREKQSELRDMESALRSISRDDWYAGYLKTLQRREEARQQRLAKQEAEQQRERDKQAARERYIAMSPQAREAEGQRLQAIVDGHVAKYDELTAAREANRAEGKALYAKREVLRAEMVALAQEVRSKWDAFHELRKNGADKAALDEAAEQARAFEEQKKPEQAAVKEKYNHVETDRQALSDAYSAINEARGEVANERYEAERFHRYVTAPIRPQGDPQPQDAQAREKQREVEAKARIEARDKQREDWQLVIGKEIDWQDNPFAGDRVRIGGGISNGQSRFQVLHDCEDYHALFIVEGKQRGMVVIDQQGQVVFNGPVNTAADRRSMTLDLYYLWEFLDGQIRININGR